MCIFMQQICMCVCGCVRVTVRASCARLFSVQRLTRRSRATCHRARTRRPLRRTPCCRPPRCAPRKRSCRRVLQSTQRICAAHVSMGAGNTRVLHMRSRAQPSGPSLSARGEAPHGEANEHTHTASPHCADVSGPRHSSREVDPTARAHRAWRRRAATPRHSAPWRVVDSARSPPSAAAHRPTAPRPPSDPPRSCCRRRRRAERRPWRRGGASAAGPSGSGPASMPRRCAPERTAPRRVKRCSSALDVHMCVRCACARRCLR